MYESRFPALDISVESDRHRLYDHGAVQDIGRLANDLYAQHNSDERFYERPKSETLGLYVGFTEGDITEHHILYKPNGGFYTRAHEETHALHHMHELPKLQELLYGRGLKIDLSSYRNPDAGDEQTQEMNNEYVAHIGALYALEKEGQDIAAFIAEQQSRKSLPIGMKEALWTFGKALESRDGKPIPMKLQQLPVPQHVSYEPVVIGNYESQQQRPAYIPAAIYVAFTPEIFNGARGKDAPDLDIAAPRSIGDTLDDVVEALDEFAEIFSGMRDHVVGESHNYPQSYGRPQVSYGKSQPAYSPSGGYANRSRN